MVKDTMEVILCEGLNMFAEYVYRIDCGMWIDQKNYRSMFGEPVTNVSKGHIKYHHPLSLAVIEIE